MHLQCIFYVTEEISFLSSTYFFLYEPFKKVWLWLEIGAETCSSE